jgi:hypothetical protein
VDQSIIVFGIVFPRAAQKHRLQMLDHFSDHIKQQVKSSQSVVGAAAATVTAATVGGGGGKNAAAEAVQMNIFTAVLSSLKGLVAAKAKFGQDDVKEAAVKLILGKFKEKKSFLSYWVFPVMNLILSTFILGLIYKCKTANS